MAEVLGLNSCAKPAQDPALSSPKLADSISVEVQSQAATHDVGPTKRCCMGTQTTTALVNGAHRPLATEAERGTAGSRGTTRTEREVGAWFQGKSSHDPCESHITCFAFDTSN